MRDSKIIADELSATYKQEVTNKKRSSKSVKAANRSRHSLDEATAKHLALIDELEQAKLERNRRNQNRVVVNVGDSDDDEDGFEKITPAQEKANAISGCSCAALATSNIVIAENHSTCAAFTDLMFAPATSLHIGHSFLLVDEARYMFIYQVVGDEDDKLLCRRHLEVL